MESDWKQELAQLVASVRNTREAGELLVSLLTPAEHSELAKRWQIVKQLMVGAPQRVIHKDLSASIATVTRGSRELQHGNGTFQKFHKRLQGR